MLPQNKIIKLTILLSLSIILTNVSVLFASVNKITSISVDAESPQKQITINLKVKERVKNYQSGLLKKSGKRFVFYMDVSHCYMLKDGATFKKKVKDSSLSSVRIAQNRLNPPVTRIACDLTKPIKPDIKLKDGYIQLLFSFDSSTPHTRTPSESQLNQITGVNVISEEPHLQVSIELDVTNRVDYGRGMLPLETAEVKSVFYLDIRNARPMIDGEEYFVHKFDHPIVSQMEIVRHQFIPPVTRIAFYLSEPIKPEININNNRQIQITFPNPGVPFTTAAENNAAEVRANPAEHQVQERHPTDINAQKPVDVGDVDISIPTEAISAAELSPDAIAAEDGSANPSEPVADIDVQSLIDEVEAHIEGAEPSDDGKPNPLQSFLSSMLRKMSPKTANRTHDNAPSVSPLDDNAEIETALRTPPELLKPLEPALVPNLTQANLTGERIACQSPIETLDMKDTDIRDALRMLAKQGGINIVVDESVRGRVSVSLNKTTPEQAIAQVLSANGFAYEKLDEYLLAYAPGASNVPTITRVIPLHYSPADDIKDVLISLASAPEAVKADSHTNSVIITDTPSKVRDMEEIVKRLDVPVEKSSRQTQSQIFHLQFAEALGLQETINQFLSENGKIAVDNRTNSLIVLDAEANIKTIAQLIQQLDVETNRPKMPSQETDGVVTRVFSLKYIDANSFMDSIKDILSPDGKIQTFVRQKELLKPARQKESDEARYEEGGLAAKPENEKEEIRKWSNILIVTDIPPIIKVVEELVETLDVMAEQVVIEAKIVEVTLDGTHELGIDWQAVHEPSGSKFSSHPIKAQEFQPTIQIGTLSAKAFKNITGMLHALEEKGQARLLANPRTTSLNNELAQIIVADRFPIPVISQNELGNITGYEYIDVGIVLTVIPHINEDGYILMEASPQIDSLKEEVEPGAPPIISSRLAHCRVMVKDGQTLVIGGLMKDETNEEISRIPLFGRIPVLGRLFSSKSLKTTKTDLIVFITPRIYREGVE